MAFVPGFEHDLFVSYAHRDDLVPAGAKQGWVTTFCQEIRSALSQKLEGQPPDVWSDHRIGIDGELGPELTEALDRSAVLLILLSPPYVASKWCQSERRIFMELVRRKTIAGSSVFIVEKDRVETRPDELAQRFGLRFWMEDPNDQTVTETFGWPDPNKHAEAYWSAINRLACKLADYLRHLSSGDHRNEFANPPTVTRPAGGLQRANTSSRVVLVAETTGDLFDERQQVLNYLEQAGMVVLPNGDYPNEPEAVRSVVEQCLPQCDLFVQLLGPKPWKRWDAWPLGLPGLQIDIALKSGKPILQWRDPNIQTSAVTDAAYRALLDGPNVRACGIEEFKATILDRLRVKDAPPDVDSSRMVLINAVEEDTQTTDALVDWLGRNQVDVIKWVDRKSGTGDLSKLAEALSISVGYMIVRGRNAGVSWIARQLQQGRKYGAQRVPKTSLAVYDCGPKEDISFLPGGVPYLDCREQFNEPALKGWLATLGVQADGRN